MKKKMNNSKWHNLSFKSKNILLILLCFFLLSISTIGYSALNSKLNITGDLVIRSIKDIRITDLQILNTVSSSSETYNSKYTVNTITIGADLPNVDSSITYRATITNSGSADMEITSIYKSINVDYAKVIIRDLYVDDVIKAGSTKTFTIEIIKTKKISNTAVSTLIELGFDTASTKYLAYHIEGNSVQNGIPTPDNPIDIESVGDKTNNLFNALTGRKVKKLGEWSNSEKRDFTGDGIYLGLTSNNYYSGGVKEYNIISDNVVAVALNDRYDGYGIGFDFAVVPGETYTFSSSGTGYVGFGLYSADGVFLSEISALMSNCRTITIPENCYWITVILRPDPAKGLVTYNDLQLVKGTEVTEYEPYGYKIPVKLSGNNLMNVPSQINSNSYIYRTEELIDSLLDLKPNVSYKYIGSYSYIGPDDANNMYGGILVRLEPDDKPMWIELGKNFTLPYKIKEVTNIYGVNVGSWQLNDAMIIKDGETEDYEPYVEPTITNIYLKEPLRKVGSLADYIDFKEGNVVRNVQKMVITGAESGWKQTVEYPWRYFLPIDGLNFGDTSKDKAISNYFQANTDGWSTNIPGRIMTGNNRFTLTWDSSKALNDFKNFLKEKSETENPVEIYYLLNTPIIEKISLPEIIKNPYYRKAQILTNVETDFTYEFVRK